MKTLWVRGSAIASVTCLALGISPGGAHANPMYEPEPAHAVVTVERIVDGDTIDVLRDGQQVRVRLLNINTPESVDPNKAPECGGAEATDWLRRRLPAGSAVTLTHDVELLDPYGRELALVTASDGEVVNVEIARNGLGEAVRFEPNERFYPEVLAAQDVARADGVGLFGPEMPCTLAAQVQAQISALAPAGGGTQGAAGSAVNALDFAESQSARVWLSLLFGVFTVDGRLLGYAGRARLVMRYAEAHAMAPAVRERLVTASEKEVAHSTPAPAPKRPTETVRRIEQRSDATPRSDNPSPDAGSNRQVRKKARSAGGGAGSDRSGYTGKRCYAPGGKTWRPC